MTIKQIFFLVAAITGSIWYITASAQEVCSIRYTYDKAGHRTQREYKCETPPDHNTPSPWLNPGGVISKVYPVPTSGVFHIEFSAAVSSAYLYITDINGAHILEQTISQLTSTATFDLTPYAPGNYILTGIFSNSMESFPVTKQ